MKVQINKRISELESQRQDDLPYPLNYLKGRISDADFAFIEQSELSLADAMFVDNLKPEAVRYRTICMDADLLPPLNFK